MTQREFYTAIANGTINEEVQTFAASAIEKMDKRNATRRSKPTKSQRENEETKAKILDFMGDKEHVLASEVAAEFGFSTQKASGLMKLLVDDGRVTAFEVKVPKQGKRKAYTLAAE